MLLTSSTTKIITQFFDQLKNPYFLLTAPFAINITSQGKNYKIIHKPNPPNKKIPQLEKANFTQSFINLLMGIPLFFIMPSL
jgi:hypothetical protein